MLQLREHIEAVIKENNLFLPNDRILLGVSGGPDSVALLNLLFDVNRVKPSYSDIIVAHLNHSIRGKEADEDERFVNNLVKKFGFSIVTEKRDIKEIACDRKISLEEAAREERYMFFESVATRVDANIVAVGHNADDNAETILHRIIRGTGIVGISGIKLKRKLTQDSTIELVRPLLFTWRKDIIAYLKEKNISYRVDSTNVEIDKFRNKIRAELIPHLEKDYNPKIKKSLVKLGETAKRNSDFLSAKANALYKECLLDEGKIDKYFDFGEIVFDVYKLKKAPQILQQIVIREAIVRLKIPLKKISYKNYEKILDIINSQKISSNNVVKDYLNIRITNNALHLSKDKYYTEEVSILSETVITIPGETILAEINSVIIMEIRETKDGFLEEFKRKKTKHDEAVDLDKIKMPLTVRTRMSGDRFCPLGSTGAQKVKDFFINNKVPVLERDTIPIITMSGRPIWIVGFRVDGRIRVTKETKNILIMKFRGSPIGS
ncbi:MAG: tRNA lysidine(34) synthetase TilS [Candidatus Brocadiaceae bacterium]|nr:tRNA lysidine(34) synthetase TilS [Candidatus Brocadiaceae bacterium]